jgi:tetratricopeptide (TPR) repeat protein
VSESEDEPLTPEEDAALAEELLYRGDLAHGAARLAAALAAEPHNPDLLALIDRYVDATDDPLALAPLAEGEEGTYFGTAALRAAILARTGRVAEGVALLLDVVTARPDVPYLDWALDWLTREPAAGALVPRGNLLSFFGATLQRFPGTLVEGEAERQELERLLRLGELTVGDPDPEPMLAYVRVALARKLGRLDEALARAERAYQTYPSYHLASALAEVHRARGDEAACLHWQQTALGHDPDNVATRLDLGDFSFDHGRYDEAARWYEEALQRAPDHPWATPSLYAARHLQGAEGWQEKLREFAAAHPDNERAAALTRQGIPFVGYLPAPQEATLGILNQLADLAARPEGAPKGEVNVTLSALEAPSARLACRLGLAALGLDVDVRFDIPSIQQPDPRLPRGEVRYQVWKYREEKKPSGKQLTTEPVAAVPEPLPAVASAVAEVARSTYDRPSWLTAGAELVRRCRPRVEDLLGVMAHPPALPQEISAPLWVQRVQVAAALALAGFESEVSWPQSRRRQLLLDLANGPMDWTVDAAIIALTATAQAEPAVISELTELFLKLLQEQPRPGHVCYEYALVCCFQQLAGLPPDLRALLIEYRRQIDSAQSA